MAEAARKERILLAVYIAIVMAEKLTIFGLICGWY